MFGCRYFYVTENGWINMFPRYFLMELWGRMQYAPTLTDEKGAFSLFVVGRGRAVLAGTGFFYLQILYGKAYGGLGMWGVIENKSRMMFGFSRIGYTFAALCMGGSLRSPLSPILPFLLLLTY